MLYDKDISLKGKNTYSGRKTDGKIQGGYRHGPDGGWKNQHFSENIDTSFYDRGYTCP